MKIIIQRVSEASVEVDNEIVGSIKKGMLILFGVHKDSKPSNIDYLANKIVHLRMFADENNKMNLNIKEVGGEILIVSQFTLYADCSKSRRPDFFQAAEPSLALEYYSKFLEDLEKVSQIKPSTGVFGAKMKVNLVNDGPVTFIIDALNR